MRPTPNLAVEAARVRTGPMGSSRVDGNNGAFVFRFNDTDLVVIASDGAGWEHVSVTVRGNRCPTWEEMCFVKELFFLPDETVVQFHPPRDVYRNCHPYCLHLWRPIGTTLPLPDPELVAPAGLQIKP